jgi:hypothetical protein
VLSNDAEQVRGVLLVHGYTPRDGLTIDQLGTDYLPHIPRDVLIAAVRELEAAGYVQCTATQPSFSVIPTPKLREG